MSHICQISINQDLDRESLFQVGNKNMSCQGSWLTTK